MFSWKYIIIFLFLFSSCAWQKDLDKTNLKIDQLADNYRQAHNVLEKRNKLISNHISEHTRLISEHTRLISELERLIQENNNKINTLQDHLYKEFWTVHDRMEFLIEQQEMFKKLFEVEKYEEGTTIYSTKKHEDSCDMSIEKCE